MDRIKREIPRLSDRTPLRRHGRRPDLALEIGTGGLFCGIDDLFHRLP
jgi:hypothetical protein